MVTTTTYNLPLEKETGKQALARKLYERLLDITKNISKRKSEPRIIVLRNIYITKLMINKLLENDGSLNTFQTMTNLNTALSAMESKYVDL